MGAQPRGGQLDGERDAVQPAADLGTAGALLGAGRRAGARPWPAPRKAAPRRTRQPLLRDGGPRPVPAAEAPGRSSRRRLQRLAAGGEDRSWAPACSSGSASPAQASTGARSCRARVAGRGQEVARQRSRLPDGRRLLTPSAPATVWGTGRDPPRRELHQPGAIRKASTTPAATRRGQAGLADPAGSEQGQQARCSQQHCRPLRATRSRPTNEVNCCGRLFGVLASERSAGKLWRNCACCNWYIALRRWPGHAGAPAPRSRSASPAGKRSRKSTATACDNRTWPPWAALSDACRTIDFATEEVVVAKFLDTDMHTAACPQRDTVHRFAVREGELELHHRRNRVERIVECRVHSVTGHFDQRAAVIGYRFAGHKIVHCERTPHPLRLLIPQLGTVL